jgi:hypothetical protein
MKIITYFGFIGRRITFILNIADYFLLAIENRSMTNAEIFNINVIFNISEVDRPDIRSRHTPLHAMASFRSDFPILLLKIHLLDFDLFS